MPCSRSCCGADTLNHTQPPALPPTGCTDLPIRACPRLTRQIDPLRYGRVSGGLTEAVVAEVVWVSRQRNARRSGLSEAAVEGLARRVMVAICREWPRSKGSLDSSVVYARLVVERAELPNYAMHDALKRLEEKDLIIAPPAEIRSDDEVRAHGGMTIEGVDTNFCEEV